MIYKIGLLGATGRMGLQIASLLSNDYSVGDNHLELADAVSNDDIRSVEGVDVRKLTDPPREPVHAWIDFSRPEATIRLLETIDTPILIGTTGLNQEHMARVKRYAETHPVIVASNVSSGMNALFAILQQMTPIDWVSEVYVAEEHHRQKQDSPSGTAKDLVAILRQRGFNPPDVLVPAPTQYTSTATVRSLCSSIARSTERFLPKGLSGESFISYSRPDPASIL
jgi:4-hydroxy-tetrahydrodipicolinate reductase